MLSNMSICCMRNFPLCISAHITARRLSSPASLSNAWPYIPRSILIDTYTVNYTRHISLLLYISETRYFAEHLMISDAGVRQYIYQAINICSAILSNLYDGFTLCSSLLCEQHKPILFLSIVNVHSNLLSIICHRHQIKTAEIIAPTSTSHGRNQKIGFS